MTMQPVMQTQMVQQQMIQTTNAIAPLPQGKWIKGTENPNIIWFTDVDIQSLADPTKEENLVLKADLNFTSDLAGCLLQVWIFVWSKNNPENTNEWVEVKNLCLDGTAGRKERVTIDIPMIGDESFRKGI